MTAAKKIILALWVVVLGVVTAPANVPRASENRTWEKIAPALELRQAVALQAAELHQDEKPWRFQLAPDLPIDADGRLATGFKSGWSGSVSSSSPSSGAFNAGMTLGATAQGFGQSFGQEVQNLGFSTASMLGTMTGATSAHYAQQSWQAGNYGDSLLWGANSLLEAGFTVATFGEGSAIKQGLQTTFREVGAAAKTTATAADNAAFWSGRAGANRAAAEASGLTTLERTSAGQALEAQDLFSKLPYDQAIVPWENLSRQFASEASGTVKAWTGGASPTSVWSRIEKPTLMLNSNVNKIIIQDATQPWKTKII